ncbi:MAG TPA: LysR family transcriptional regulator [Candidatus Atopostipes pullistercoris]|uniref:LysR family transcriptional regulator n=1 Tax=Candidatus Atopostipes pullistercoris TaxID=2838467 RepID=A0A9D2G253_9LACT|nr:LysR family transcriptional regulator [Candidatus Atopostipes pullistercoris]
MDTRLLEYFLTIAQEENMTRAAEILHVTQPTLSKQLNKLEDLFGVKLFHRESRRMVLTKEGYVLRNRAKSILDLTDKTFNDLQKSEEVIHGTIKLSVAESDGFRHLVKIIKQIHQKYPMITFDIHSGDAFTVTEQLDQGLVDFGLLVGTPNLEKYHALKLPKEDRWGIFMKNEDPLAAYDAISPKQLKKQPLILSNQALKTNELTGWLGGSMEEANIFTTYNLINNAILMAEEGLGYLVALDKLIDSNKTDKLVFRPLHPQMNAPLYFIWHQHHVLSSAASIFLEAVRTFLSY